MSFVAVSKVKYPEALKKEIQDVGRAMIPTAKRQPGFISIAFHQSTASNETMMYWEWESQADHEACMACADWQAVMEKSKTLFEAEGVAFSLETFDRLA